jgi:ferrous iron transport protein B
MILGLLNSVSFDGSFGNQDSERSVLSATSKAVTPIFSPMGLEQQNWPATVGIFTGVFAKEAMVGTLNSIYSQLAGEDNPNKGAAQVKFDFWGQIQEAIATIPANLAQLPNQLLDPLGLNIGDLQDQKTAAEKQKVDLGIFGAMAKRFDGQAGAFAYLLFVLLYFPCVSATSAVYRETNAGWTVFIALWTTGMAYIVATSFYQIATFSRHPGFSLFWIVLMGLTVVGVLFTLKNLRPRKINRPAI